MSLLKRIRNWFAGLVLAIGSALGLYVTAQTPTYSVTVTMPTAYTSDQPLPLSDLASLTVVYSVDGGAAQTKVVTSLAAVTSTTIPKALGRTCVAAFVTTKATAAAPNSASAQTDQVCVVNAGVPRMPSGLRVE